MFVCGLDLTEPRQPHRACKDIVTRLLEKNERRRLGSETGASEVKSHRWFAKVNWGLLRHTRPPVKQIIILCCKGENQVDFVLTDNTREWTRGGTLSPAKGLVVAGPGTTND